MCNLPYVLYTHLLQHKKKLVYVTRHALLPLTHEAWGLAMTTKHNLQDRTKRTLSTARPNCTHCADCMSTPSTPAKQQHSTISERASLCLHEEKGEHGASAHQEPVPVPLGPQEISNGLARGHSRACTVRGRRS